MLGVGAAAGVGGEDDQLAACTAPGVCCVGDVEMDVVVSCKAACVLACGVKLGDGLVQVGVGVEVATPQVLAVSRIGAAGVALLGAVV